MTSRVDPESDLRKCPECVAIWILGSGGFCMCEVDGEPCIALTQPEIDAMLDAERVRVEQSVGVSLEAMKAQAARIAELEKALEPFAECAPHISERLRDDFSVWGTVANEGNIYQITIGHIREAARVRGEKLVPHRAAQGIRDKLAARLRQYRRWRDDERKSKARYEKRPGWDFMADKCDDIAEDWQDIARAYLQALIDAGIAYDIWGAMVARDKAKELTQ